MIFKTVKFSAVQVFYSSMHGQLLSFKVLLFSQRRCVCTWMASSPQFLWFYRGVGRNLSFLAQIIGVWYQLCIRENRPMVERQDPTRMFIDSHKSTVNFTRAPKVWLGAVLKMGGFCACALYPGWEQIEGEPTNPFITCHLDSRSFCNNQVSLSI